MSERTEAIEAMRTVESLGIKRLSEMPIWDLADLHTRLDELSERIKKLQSRLDYALDRRFDAEVKFNNDVRWYN